MNLSDYPHRRFNPLLGEWASGFSAQDQNGRGRERWKNPRRCSTFLRSRLLSLPGNIRADGSKTRTIPAPMFLQTRFFRALIPTIPSDGMSEKNLLGGQSERGFVGKVICFSPQHNLTLALMAPEDLRSL